MSIAHEATPRRRTVAPPTIREHRIPTAGSKPYIAVEGRDHCLWFCESGASKIGRLDPKSYTFKEFDLPTANATPIGIVVGPEGNLLVRGKIRRPDRPHHAARSGHRVPVADSERRSRRHAARALTATSGSPKPK
jgi:streptogramin lyase